MGEPVRKKRRTSPPGRTSPPESTTSLHNEENEQVFSRGKFSQQALKWNLEQDYEQRPRKQKKGKENKRLPIKTAEGRIEQLKVGEEEEASNSSGDDLDTATPDTELSNDEADIPTKVELPVQQQILEAKEELARIASLLNEAPEEHIGSLKILGEITSSQIAIITKLGLITQLSVYKDIVPGYRIRPLTEQDGKDRVSKDVRKLRDFEQSIVRGYHKYVQDLGRIAALGKTDASKESISLAGVAVSCACNLVTSLPHFNFRTELLKILVNKLASREAHQDFDACCQAVQLLFTQDDDGHASQEAVAMLCKMFKAKNFRIHERALNLFLHLRLLTEFSHKASTDRVDKSEDRADQTKKQQKAKREFRTKKMRKIFKERKAIEKEMKEADAVVSHEQRDQLQAETLKLVFGVYFRILKARTPGLMGPVLEGLVKYAHLINQDFFGDLLEALKDLINDIDSPLTTFRDDNEEEREEEPDSTSDPTTATSNATTRESLLCVITAFALLQGQDGTTAATTLNLDLTFFITHLYRTLHPASLNADIELSSKSLHLPDPHSSQTSSGVAEERTKVNVHTTIVLLLRSLHATLLPTNTRSVPPIRLAAFTKQILTCCLNLPEKSSTAMLGLVNQLVKTHKRKVSALWNTEERRADGVFDATSGRVEGSNPFATTVWEGELLRLHYSPTVREGTKFLEEVVVDDGK